MSDTNGNGNGTERKFWAKTLIENLIRIHSSTPKKMWRGETREQYRERRDFAAAIQESADNSKRLERKGKIILVGHRNRILALIGERWGVSFPSVMKFMNTSRRPYADSTPKFFEDLRRFGAVRFHDKTGELLESTLDRGPSTDQFRNDTPAGKDRRRAEVS